jgi:hypothetical protein
MNSHAEAGRGAAGSLHTCLTIKMKLDGKAIERKRW